MDFINKYIFKIITNKVNNFSIANNWKSLCEDYCHQKENRFLSNYFFRSTLEYQCALHYAHAVDAEGSDYESFFSDFNKTFRIVFNPERNLSKLLAALFTFYPEHLHCLDENIRKKLNITPFTPFSETNIGLRCKTLMTKLNPRVVKGYISGYERNTRAAAAYLLERIGILIPNELKPTLIDALILRLQDTQPMVRKAAIQTLGTFTTLLISEEEQEKISQALLNCLTNLGNPEDVKNAAGTALIKQFHSLTFMQQQARIKFFFKLSEDSNSDIRKIALHGLCELHSKLNGIQRQQFIEQLSLNLWSDTRTLRQAVAADLNQFSLIFSTEEQQFILTRLSSKLISDDTLVRSIAAEVMGELPLFFVEGPAEKQKNTLKALMNALTLNLTQTKKLTDLGSEELRYAPAITAKTLGQLARALHIISREDIQKLLILLFENLRNAHQYMNTAGSEVLLQLAGYFSVLEKEQRKIALVALLRTMLDPRSPPDADQAAKVMCALIPHLSPEQKQTLRKQLYKLCTDKSIHTRSAATIALVHLYIVAPDETLFKTILEKLDDNSWIIQETIIRDLPADIIADEKIKDSLIDRFNTLLTNSKTSWSNKLLISERCLGDLSELFSDHSKKLALNGIENLLNESLTENKLAAIETIHRLLITQNNSFKPALLNLLIPKLNEHPRVPASIKNYIEKSQQAERTVIFDNLFPALLKDLKEHPDLNTTNLVGELILTCLTRMDEAQKTIFIESYLLNSYKDALQAQQKGYATALFDIILTTSAERVKAFKLNTPSLTIQRDAEEKQDLSSKNLVFS
ncbi:MAG: HEAT repeat domain-containing protein [Gammaproteobacteria bacterium]|nr:HEAT repeat domain-containing protein [Gammaproteobacteria bacterium]